MLAVCRRCVLSGLLAPECNEEHEQSRDGMSKYSKYSKLGGVMLATGQPGPVVASRGLLPECDGWWAVVGVTSPCSALVSSVRGRAMTAPVPSRVAHPGLDTRPRIVQSFRGNINII